VQGGSKKSYELILASPDPVCAACGARTTRRSQNASASGPSSEKKRGAPKPSIGVSDLGDNCATNPKSEARHPDFNDNAPIA
jgi:hypothetical protein